MFVLKTAVDTPQLSKANYHRSAYGTVKAKFHYAILVADRYEAGRRPAASWILAYHLAR